MNLIDINNSVVETRQVVHRLLYALFKVTAILCAGKHCCHVNLVNLKTFEAIGHIAILNALRQTIDKRRLANARLAHMQRIVVVEMVVDAGHKVAHVDFM